MNDSYTIAKITKANDLFTKIMCKNSQDEDEIEFEKMRRKTVLLKEKKDKMLKDAADKEIKNRSKADQKKIDAVMEKFFIAWFITKDFPECKSCCDVDKVYFYDKKDGNDSQSYHIIMIQMYYYQQGYEREKVKMENHVMDGNTLWYRAKKRNGTYFDGFIEFMFNEKFKITRIDVGTLDENGNLISTLHPEYRNKKNKGEKIDRFEGIPPKTYKYKVEEPIKLTPLPLWDPERFLEQQKGTLYAIMFKLYKAWMLSQDIDDLSHLIAPDAKLYDKVLNKEIYSNSNIAAYFFTFVSHHFVSGIYVRQYKIIDNELILRVHWPDKSQWTDILVATRINRETSLFTEITIKTAYFDAFIDPNDVKEDTLTKMESVYRRRLIDKNRKREDYKSAVFFEMDQNMKDLDLDTFETSDTEVFLRDKLINETPSQYKTIQIQPRENIVPSPKAPLKLIYNFKTPSYDTDELFGNPTPEDDDGNKIKKVKKQKRQKTAKDKKGLICSDDSIFGSTRSDSDNEKIQKKIKPKKMQKKETKKN